MATAGRSVANRAWREAVVAPAVGSGRRRRLVGASARGSLAARALLVFACAAGAVGALLMAAPATVVGAPGVGAVAAGADAARVIDADLALLLRLMATLKLGLVALVGAGAWWRAGHWLEPALATAYAAGVGVMLLAAALLLQLSHLAAAAATFHGAAFTLLLLLLQDRDLAESVLPGLLARRRARSTLPPGD